MKITIFLFIPTLHNMKKVKFLPGDLNYELKREASSPFSKRNITPPKKISKSKTKLFRLQRKWYELFYANSTPTFLSRLKKEAYIVKKATGKPFVLNKLRANKKQIDYITQLFFEQLLESLKADPQSLFEQSAKIQNLCNEFKYDIPVIQSFNQIEGWDEFLIIFESISEKESQFKVELLMALITQYSNRCE